MAATAPYDLRVFTRMTDPIERTMRRRAAVEPVMLAAIGNNFRRLLNWLALWLALSLYTLRLSQKQA